MRVFVAAVAVLLVAAPSVAAAAPPNLSRHGIAVTWPKGDTVPANAPFEVKVQSKREKVSLKLTRVSESGKLMRVLARKTVHTGALNVTLPATVGARYRLTMEAVDREWTEDFKTSCGAGGTPGVEGNVTPAAARSGDRVVLRMHNTGTSCLSYGSVYGWERQLGDGSWQNVPIPGNNAWTAEGRSLTPSSWTGESVWVWPTEPGAYRLTRGFGDARLAVPFTILP